MEDSQQPGNHNNLTAILGSMLKRIIGVDIPCASNLPGEFLEACETHSYDCIPVLSPDNVIFHQIPPNIIDPKANESKSFRDLLRNKGITPQYDTTELLTIKGITDCDVITELLKNKGLEVDDVCNTTEKILRKNGITNEDDINELLESMQNTDEDDLTEGLIAQIKHNHACNRVPLFYPLAWISLKVANSIKTMITPFDRFGKQSFIHSLSTFIPVNEDYRIRNVFFTQLIAILLKRVPYNVNTKLEYSYYISNTIKLNLFIATIG